MNKEYLNDVSARVHGWAVLAGWWDNPNRCLVECMQLVSTEVAEATEGARKGLQDDHLPQYPMEVVELADALIRVLDLGGKMDLLYRYTGAFPNWSGRSVGFLHFQINVRVVRLFSSTHENMSETGYAYSRLIDCIIEVARQRGYGADLLAEAMEAKIVYNQHRADHKREARAAEGGKKF